MNDNKANNDEHDKHLEPSIKKVKYESEGAVVTSSESENIQDPCQQEKGKGGDALPADSRDVLANDTSYINASILSCVTHTELQKHYNDFTDFLDDATGVEFCCFPFHHCILLNFINNTNYIADLEAVLLDLPLREKNNDLYKFRQSQDLNHSQSPALLKFRSICDSLRIFLSKLTGIPLNNKIDLFCSHYQYTDVLLCHDDELEERRLAFIYYLVPEQWDLSDGGTLDLFDTDVNGQPKSIVKSIVPKRNSFLFFEVSAASFHQVSEVLSKDLTRLSISGWFHGPPLPRPAGFMGTLPDTVPYGTIEEEIFYGWVNPTYLAAEIQADIRKQFEEDSEIELKDFLQEDKYLALTAALQGETISWTLLGPANKRNYYSADLKQLPPVVTEFLQVIHSDAAFLVLSSLTGLRLHPLAHSDQEVAGGGGGLGDSSADGAAGNPRCRSEIRRWEHGCYTLAHDTDMEMQDFVLDTIMYIGCDEEWSFENGGYTAYIAKGEEEELLSVCPSRNSLALVYRDKDTMKFVKHLNHRVTSLSPSSFLEVNTVYYE